MKYDFCFHWVVLVGKGNVCSRLALCLSLSKYSYCWPADCYLFVRAANKSVCWINRCGSVLKTSKCALSLLGLGCLGFAWPGLSFCNMYAFNEEKLIKNSVFSVVICTWLIIDEQASTRLEVRWNLLMTYCCQSWEPKLTLECRKIFHNFHQH